MAELFTREDLSKPENRINVAIFGMMTVPRFSEWLLAKLNLPPDSLLYPPRNTANDHGAGRPDFAIQMPNSDEVDAYIEVECWRDEEQMARFRGMFPDKRIIAIWGKPEPGCDFSLTEIAAYLTAATWGSPQTELNARHLRDLITDALSGGYSGSKPATVGNEMWDSPFVTGLRAALGARLERFTLGQGNMRSGEIRMDTTDSKDNKGFSIRVHSPWPTKKSVSILNRSGGRPEIRFSGKDWLDHYLRSHSEAVRELTALIAELGGDMEQAWKGERIAGARPKGNNTTPIRLADAEANVDRIASLIAKLADRPV